MNAYSATWVFVVYSVSICSSLSTENDRASAEDTFSSRSSRLMAMQPERRSMGSRMDKEALSKLRTQDHSLDDSKSFEEIAREMLEGKSNKVWGKKSMNDDLMKILSSIYKSSQSDLASDYQPKQPTRPSGIWGKRMFLGRPKGIWGKREALARPAGVWGRSIVKDGKLVRALDTQPQRPPGLWGREVEEEKDTQK